MGLYGVDIKTIGTAVGWLLWSGKPGVLGGGLFFKDVLSYTKKVKQCEGQR